MKKTKVNYKEAGITLVALVVTIIVLLILAGVTISLALGDNGIIGKAQEASNTYANASKDERTALNELSEEVSRLSRRGDDDEGGSGGGSTGPVIKDKDGATIDLANIASYYGHDVTYNGQTYQLFYYDATGKYGEAGRIWLQHKDYVDGVKLSDHYETTGILTDNANSKIWEVNPDLKTKYQANIRAIAESSLNNNIKGVAYLCNTANWNETYVGTAGVNAGAYAIGGVSAEMYCDSYTQATGTIFSARAYSENSTYGYRYKPGHSDASVNTDGYGYYSDYTNYPLTTEKGGMYNLGSGKYPWLASPSSIFTANGVCRVNGDDGSLSIYGTDGTNGVRPAVSLPSNIQIQLIS